MSYLSDPKDPSEIVAVVFDFGGKAEPPANPTFSVSVRWGNEEPCTLAASGNPTISDNQVSQLFAGGADLNDYNVVCTADGPDGVKVVVAHILAVRTAPTA